MLSWRRIATLGAFIAIAAIALFAALDRSRAGTPSARLVPDGAASNRRFVVTKVLSTSLLHRDDRVEIDDPGTLAALQFQGLAAGSTLRVRRIAPLPQVTLDEPIVRYALPRIAFVFFAIEALFIGIAILIAARARASGALSLAWLFGLLTLVFNQTAPAWPTWLILINAIAQGPIAIVAFSCATDFATRFAGDATAPWARRMRAISRGIALVAICVGAGLSLDSFYRPTTPVALQDAAMAAIVSSALLFLVALGIAYAQASAVERPRVSWVAASLGAGIVSIIVSILAQIAGISEPLRDYPLLLLIAMPLGCAYAILRYRLLDVAFVVNRATVFGVTSLLVIAALALVDFGLQALLGSWILHTGSYVQLGLALAIGIATRPVHARVDHFVDDLFFRQRHEAERALRQFAREVSYIDDSDVVLERTVATVARAARRRCAVLLTAREGLVGVAASAEGSLPAFIDRNDGAVVRLRAEREPVDPYDVQTAIAGDFAFPMFARNRLLGVLVCGDRTTSVTTYAPDELSAIGAVAHASGLALDLLRIEALERELAATRRGLSYEAGTPVS